MSLTADNLLIAYALEVQGEAEASAALDHFDQKLEQTGDKTETAAKQTEALKPAYDRAILGFSGAAAGAFALYNQYDHLEKIQLRIATAEKNRDAAQKAVIDAQAKLTALTEQGITSGAKYESAVLGLKNAQAQLAISTEKVDLAQGDLTQSQISFGLSVVPTVTSAVTAFRGAMDALKVAQAASTATTAAMTPALAGTTAAMSSTAAATGTATGALGAFRIALNFIAAHPIILPLTAIAGVLVLIATNFFGVRDAIDAFARKVEEAVPILKPVFDFFRTIAAAIAPDTQKAFADTQMVVATGVERQKIELQRLESHYTVMKDNTSTSMKEMADNVEKETNRVVNSVTRMQEQFKQSVAAQNARVDPFKAPDLNEKQKADKAAAQQELADVKSQIQAWESEVKRLGGSLTMPQLREAFRLGQIGGDFDKPFAELDRLAKRRDELMKKIEALTPKEKTFQDVAQQNKLSDLIASGLGDPQGFAARQAEARESWIDDIKQAAARQREENEARKRHEALADRMKERQRLAIEEKASILEDLAQIVSGREVEIKPEFRINPDALRKLQADIEDTMKKMDLKFDFGAKDLQTELQKVKDAVREGLIEPAQEAKQSTSQDFAGVVKAAESMSIDVAGNMAGLRQSMAREVDESRTSLVSLQDIVKETRIKVAENFHSMASSVNSTAGSMIANANRIADAISKIAAASRSLGGTSITPPPAPTSYNNSSGGASAPTTIIIQLDGREIARYIGGGNTLKYV